MSSGGAVLASAGLGLLGANKAADAATESAQIQADAANRAADLAQQRYYTSRSDQQPFMQAGYGGTKAINSLLGLGAPDGSATFGTMTAPLSTAAVMPYMNPFIGSALNLGLQGVMNRNAATDGAFSGAASKDMVNYTLGLLGPAWDSAVGNYQTDLSGRYSRLASLASLGENSAANVGNQGVQLASLAGENIVGAANAQASGIVGSANAYNSALSGIGNNAMQYYMLNQIINNPYRQTATAAYI